LNLKKYKRMFAFGCSMTNYHWPTWADLIGSEIPEFYNYGQSGAGNMYIANAITEANRVHKFTKDDLVMVMWSTITREDRYKDRVWRTPGNIFTQGEYDMKFVMKWADVRGYLIRDMSLVDLTVRYLKSFPTDFYMFQMSPFIDLQLELENGEVYYEGKDIMDAYKESLAYVRNDICNVACGGKWPTINIKGYAGEECDYHPDPLMHLSYIRKTFPNFKVTNGMKELAKRYNEIIEESEYVNDVRIKWDQERSKKMLRRL
jgi:hypothetical protein